MISVFVFKQMKIGGYHIGKCVFLFLTLVVSQMVPAQSFDSSASVDTAKTIVQLKPLVLAHYMPWFSADIKNNNFGWHWSMGHFDPSEIRDGKRSLASHYYPLIGPYDSSDPDTVEYHLLTMKLTGIDGVIVDWYGTSDLYDYQQLDRNSAMLFKKCKELEMWFCVCYETQTLDHLIAAKKIAEDDRVSHAISQLDHLGKVWCNDPTYTQLDGKPMLLSFGQTGLADEQWTEVLKNSKTQFTYFSQHRTRAAASGKFDWPVPKEGLKAVDRFLTNEDAGSIIPVVFPRFHDIYQQAQVHSTWGKIEDDDGATFRNTWAKAIASGAPIIQLATWNDWGEGTQLEPSQEFEFRDLEFLQKQRHLKAHKEDLRLPLELYHLRKNGVSKETCAAILSDIQHNRFEEAREKISKATDVDITKADQ